LFLGIILQMKIANSPFLLHRAFKYYLNAAMIGFANVPRVISITVKYAMPFFWLFELVGKGIAYFMLMAGRFFQVKVVRKIIRLGEIKST